VDLEALLQKYRAKGLLIDTNLLVLLAVETYKRGRITTFKRTFQYTLDDFALLVCVLGKFERRIVTPNILTEADNLARQLPEAEHEAVAVAMADLVAQFFEQYRPSIDVVHADRFARLGLTDCVTVSFSNDVLVMTDDFRLSNTLLKLGRDAININHIRTLS
jgi:hypothetical protein